MKKIFALLVRMLTWQKMIDNSNRKWNENDLSIDASNTIIF